MGQSDQPAPVVAPSPTGARSAEGAAKDAHASNGHGAHHASFLALTLGSIGVVYGDIGTSPIYAFREALAAADQDGKLTNIEIMGVVSLILWALILIVCIKYMFILLRADNNGEGGTLSLMALGRRALGHNNLVVFALGVTATALFAGEAMITPAVSVLSAVEGTKYLTTAFTPYVIPITIAIIVVLFAVQSRGTSKIAAAFGPICFVWFLSMGAMGLLHIGDAPGVLAAFNPYYAVRFVAEHGHAGLIALGAVFLAVTGAEALYADLGHFGRRPIQTAWFAVVFPALGLNYLGQAAMVMAHPEKAEDPFFLMAPDFFLAPLVILSILATVIASQAVITGAFSVARQAIQLGLLPRSEVKHTSEALAGQIFMPSINRMLFIGVIILVLSFKTSSALAAAYGIAVTGTMIMNGIAVGIVVWKIWGWKPAAAVALLAPFVLVELVFFGANLLKVTSGGWLPLALAIVMFALMATWARGTRILAEKTRRSEVPLVQLLTSLEKSSMPRVPGTAIFLTSDPSYAPTALMHNIKHNKVLHKQNVIVTVRYADTPRVDGENRLTITRLSEEFLTIEMLVGYMESPNVPKILAACRKRGLAFEIMNTSFFLSRRSLISDPHSGMPQWQDRLFISLARNATAATEFFKIPTDRVVEVGTQVTV